MRVIWRCKRGRIVKDKVVKLGPEPQLLGRLPSTQQGASPERLRESSIFPPAKAKQAKPKLVHGLDSNCPDERFRRIVVDRPRVHAVLDAESQIQPIRQF